MTRQSTSVTLIYIAFINVAAATVALAQTPPDPDDKAAPSAASSPHQRDVTSTKASEAPATKDAEPAAASTPHQREVTEGGATSMKDMTPASFASQAAMVGKTEIELGQIALKNTQDEDVRKYAQLMIKDHTAADQKLKAIAAKENLQLPQSLDQQHASLKTKLQGMTGKDFDRQYVKAMASGHDKAVTLFQSASQQPKMPADLKQFAASTLPTLQQHQKIAHSLSAKEDGA